jgi:hypothetical protein
MGIIHDRQWNSSLDAACSFKRDRSNPARLKLDSGAYWPICISMLAGRKIDETESKLSSTTSSPIPPISLVWVKLTSTRSLTLTTTLSWSTLATATHYHLRLHTFQAVNRQHLTIPTALVLTFQ